MNLPPRPSRGGEHRVCLRAPAWRRGEGRVTAAWAWELGLKSPPARLPATQPHLGRRVLPEDPLG